MIKVKIENEVEVKNLIENAIKSDYAGILKISRCY